MKIISRKEALEQGLKRYFTGKPCKNGHVASRTLNGNCFECKNQQTKEWLKNRSEESKEKNKARAIEYRQQNKEKLLKRENDYREKNRDKLARLARERYHESKTRT